MEATTRRRAPRGSLNRRRIVTAALALVDEAGLQGLTMPRLAARLEVGTMSLYRHVRNKADLIDGVAELIFEDLDIPAGADDDWRERVIGYLRRWRDAAIAHPALVDILATRPLATRRIYEHLEENISILRRAGLSDVVAVRTFYAFFSYVFGFVLWELPRAHERTPDEYAEGERIVFTELPADRFPTLHQVRETMLTNASPDQFEFGLERLIESVEHLIAP